MCNLKYDTRLCLLLQLEHQQQALKGGLSLKIKENSYSPVPHSYKVHMI